MKEKEEERRSKWCRVLMALVRFILNLVRNYHKLDKSA